MYQKIPTCYSMYVLWVPFTPLQIGSWCFICLEYSFQLRELLSIKSFVFYLRGLCPCFSRPGPFEYMLSRNTPLPFRDGILVWSCRVGNGAMWLPPVALITLLAHKKGNHTCICLLHSLLHLQHQAPHLPLVPYAFLLNGWVAPDISFLCTIQ